jgi:hypothetical protein
MAKSRVGISPDLLGELSQENSKWFEFYENHPKAPKSKSHRNKVRSFLSYKEHNQRPFYSFGNADVENFKAMLKRSDFKGGGIDPYISAISKCAKILREERPDIFPPSFLSNISKSRNNEASESSGEVVTLKQISLIKKYTLEQGDLYEKYIFEKLFHQGIQLEELKTIGKEDFSRDVDLIYRANQYFKKITQYLIEKGEYARTKNINSEYFKLSHQAYFFLCPFCQERIENIAGNWILVRTEFDNEYRLVHAACKDKLK